MCDDRSNHLQTVIDSLSGDGMIERNYEAHVFELRFKYFGCRIQLTECAQIKRPNGTSYRSNVLSAIIEPSTDAFSLVTLLPHGRRRLDPQHSFCALGPYFRPLVALEINWQSDTATKPRRADGAAWREALLNAGMKHELLERLIKPGPRIRYIPPA